MSKIYESCPCFENEHWLLRLVEKWFVRWAIIDKSNGKAIGTIESFKRLSEDAFNESGVLRLDVGSTYEKADALLVAKDGVAFNGYWIKKYLQK